VSDPLEAVTEGDISMKILLPVDGSPSSSRAVRYVIRHWGDKQARRRVSFILLHVHPPLPDRVAQFLPTETRAGYYEDRSKAAARTARLALRKAALDFEERHVVGDPALFTVALAAKERCDLVAMGSHGRGAFLSTVLGSVVMKVLSRSKVPVLVVR
jgi:nucleotide-binding universal stress UspA family protein